MIVYVPRVTTMNRALFPIVVFIHRSTLMIDTFDSDAAALVRTIMESVQYIHSAGIVHRGALYS